MTKKIQRTKDIKYVQGIEVADAKNSWVVPSDSFRPDQKVIAIATRNGVELLGISESTSTISSKKQADLVLLERNPYDDISATRKIIWVMQNGIIQ